MKKTAVSLLKEILGDPLPEIDPIYEEGEQFFDPGKMARKEFLPYIMQALYTVDEMKMMLSIPGTATEIAEKTGFDISYVRRSMDQLVKKGRAVFDEDRFLRIIPNMMVYLDYTFWAIEGDGGDWSEDNLKLMKLMRGAVQPSWEYSPNTIKKKQQRIIPKLSSIENIPGVMDCENIRTIFEEAAENEEFACRRCYCALTPSLLQEGKYPGDKNQFPNGLDEGDSKASGHCYTFGVGAKYQYTVLKQHKVTKDEIEQKIAETEAKNVIYSVSNSRTVDGMCCCNFEYCMPYNEDLWDYSPSRFVAVQNMDKCVSCGGCEKICQFHAIWKRGTHYHVERNLCMGCGNCVQRCKPKALKMELVRPVEWIPD